MTDASTGEATERCVCGSEADLATYGPQSGCPTHDPTAFEPVPHVARRMTDEEAAAVLTLVRGGWLKLELTL